MEPLTLVCLAIFWAGFGHTVAVEQIKKEQKAAIAQQAKEAPQAAKAVKKAAHKK